MSGPRDVFTRKAVGFIKLSSFLPMYPVDRVESLR